jgi:hypothetical protein
VNVKAQAALQQGETARGRGRLVRSKSGAAKSRCNQTAFFKHSINIDNTYSYEYMYIHPISMSISERLLSRLI